MRKSLKAIASLVAGMLLLPLAPANAVVELKADITNLVLNVSSNLGTTGSYGSAVVDGYSLDIRYDWYACATKTSFASTRHNLWEPSVGDATVQDIADALTTHDCTLVKENTEWGVRAYEFYSGTAWNSAPIKPFGAVVQRIESDYLPYTVRALSAGVRFVEATATPTLTQGDGVINATDGTYLADESLTGSWVWGVYYICDAPVVAGGLVIGVFEDSIFESSAIAQCRELFGPWTGWDTDYHNETTFDPTAEYTDREPIDSDTPPIVDIQGKYLIRVNEARSVATWSSSVRVGGEEVPQPVTLKKRVYFGPGSSKPSAQQLKALKTWINSAKADIGEAQLSVTIKGYSQGTRKNAANLSLGLARAKSIKMALKSMKLDGTMSHSYAGPSRITGANGRFVVVTLKWTPIAER